MPKANLTTLLKSITHPLTGAAADYDPLLERVGEARFVLLGEASHGTHEFYRARAQITKRLIQEKGFTAVAVEADWPDTYRVNRYVRGLSDDAESVDALANFKRFPTWMWRNADVLDFVGWLRAYNDALAQGKGATPPLPTQWQGTTQVGFYGLDLYSLNTSIAAVLGYLDKIDPEAAQRARYRYGCFEHFGEDTQAYGYAASFGVSASCEQEVVSQLVELQRRAAEYAGRDGRVASDEFFYAEQNARLVKNAEEYYRSMFRGRASSWNLRDCHMAETLDALTTYLSRQDQRAKIVVWAHNSHLGDARATQMGDTGELNIGQLVRQRYGQEAVLVGFSTYSGTVTAASEWDGPAQRKRVRPALPESYEALFHTLELPHFLLLVGHGSAAATSMREARLERAIGVIYRPETERLSHYFLARLADQFDAVLHFDQTRAVEPLEPGIAWKKGSGPLNWAVSSRQGNVVSKLPTQSQGEAPETFPSGL
jgi:erythromycin esterase-like protein